MSVEMILILPIIIWITGIIVFITSKERKQMEIGMLILLIGSVFAIILEAGRIRCA